MTVLKKGMRVVVERALGGPFHGVVFRAPRAFGSTVQVLPDGSVSKYPRKYAQRSVTPEDAAEPEDGGERKV